MNGHSPLGASGAYRWMECPGSVGLSQGTTDEESDYAAEGTAAHALAADFLSSGEDAWTAIGQRIKPGYLLGHPHGLPVSKDMADAVQVYLDHVRRTYPDRHQGNTWIERSFHCPSVHEQFYGTADFCHLIDSNIDEGELHVIDYKHGAGILVDVEDNPQLKYYAIGMIESLDLWGKLSKVKLTIVQPRGYMAPVRSWDIDVSTLCVWLEETLIPAMNRAMVSTDLKSGEHCRFCPVRSYACPQLLADVEEIKGMMDKVKGAAELSNAEIGRLLDLMETAKIFAKAASTTGYNRAQAGQKVPGWKHGKANRVWKPETEKALVKKFGEDAFEPKTLKSPAQIETLPEGKALAERYAFKPEGKLTLVREEDARPGVSRDTKSLFKPVKKGKAA